MILIRGKPFEKHTRNAYPAPYVKVEMRALAGWNPSTVNFMARIDTGADLTCVPRIQAEKLMPLPLGKPVLVSGHDGRVKRLPTYRVIISIPGYPDENQLESYRPERGVLLTDSSVGLIGMDVGKRWKLTLDGVRQEFSVEC